jgi:hypothetical protein
MGVFAAAELPFGRRRVIALELVASVDKASLMLDPD